MNITFLGAAHEVTGSCTLIEACGMNILVDCGMEQGRDIYENVDLPVNPAKIDIVFVTHAHIDHSGMIPKLVKNGYSGGIFATHATKRLCDIMLLDSAHIQESEAEWRNRKAKRSGKSEYIPPYTTEDAKQALSQFIACEYNKKYTPLEGLSVTFTDAGHLLGSASISLEITEGSKTETILFSGDLGNRNRPLIRDPQNPSSADYVVIESTYGNRTHGPRPDYVGQLTRILQDTFDRGGNLIIPCFAVGRTQEMLYLMREIKDRGLIKNHDGFPVWVDSPLSVEATGIYSAGLTDFYDDETLELLSRGVDPIKFNDLKLSVSVDESRAINFDMTPKVIISSSGMCEAGRIRHHLKHNLWRDDCTVLFVGYQSEGTIGRKLIDGEKVVKLFGETINVNAKIETMDGISGHADMNIMLDWLGALEKAPKKVFVNHGEDVVTDEFAQTINQKFGFDAVAPYSGSCYDLTNNLCLSDGNKKKIVKKTGGAPMLSTAFEKLVLAGRRLLAAIDKNRNGANKDLEKFAREINDLASRWEK